MKCFRFLAHYLCLMALSLRAQTDSPAFVATGSPAALRAQTTTTTNSNGTNAQKYLRDLTPEEAAKVRAGGGDPSQYKVEVDSPVNPASTPGASEPATPLDLKNAVIWMDYFQGMTNSSLLVNVVEFKPEQLKFALGSQTYDYSGNFTIFLRTPRKHHTPYFGFGSAEKANFVTLEDVGGQTMSFGDATIWEKKSGFIDIETSGQEWIYSGPYTTQN